MLADAAFFLADFFCGSFAAGDPGVADTDLFADFFAAVLVGEVEAVFEAVFFFVATFLVATTLGTAFFAAFFLEAFAVGAFFFSSSLIENSIVQHVLSLVPVLTRGILQLLSAQR